MSRHFEYRDLVSGQVVKAIQSKRGGWVRAQKVEPGDWIVQWSDNKQSVFADYKFVARFKEIKA